MHIVEWILNLDQILSKEQTGQSVLPGEQTCGDSWNYEETPLLHPEPCQWCWIPGILETSNYKLETRNYIHTPKS